MAARCPIEQLERYRSTAMLQSMSRLFGWLLTRLRWLFGGLLKLLHRLVKWLFVSARRLAEWLLASPRGPDPMSPRRGWLFVILVAYAVAFLVSVLYGTPRKLPGVALGSPFLLELERAAAILGAFSTVLIFAQL